jgi:hypothetical protein
MAHSSDNNGLQPLEFNPFFLWKQWSGDFSFANNHPMSPGGVELTLINQSSKHCICGHWTGKRDKLPLGEIAPLSIPDMSANTVAGEVAEQELRRVHQEKEKILT